MQQCHETRRRSSALVVIGILTALTARGAAAQLQIVAPAPGTTVTLGQSLTVVVSPSSSVSGVGVMTESPLPEVQATTTPNQFVLTIPTSFTPGTYHLTAVGAAAGSDVESDPVAFAVERADDPVQIRVAPTDIRFRAAGDQIPLHVIGTYADGSQADLTASTRTSYSSLNTAVATVSAAGVVTAVAAGKASIQAATPGANFTIQAKVLAAAPTSLLLNNGRFQVTVSYTSAAASGQGTAVQLTPDTGYFWFFSAANVEMVIKVLNGCTLNNRYWVFAGGLTNVQTHIVVTDTKTHTTKTYDTVQGPAFAPIQDTSAFATCP